MVGNDPDQGPDWRKCWASAVNPRVRFAYAACLFCSRVRDQTSDRFAATAMS
jgi:hypothetical protein